MKLFRAFLFIILLSLSISSTTNSDHTNAEILEWKGGDGAKRSRVRRQNLHLPDAVRLPEKAYALYILWRLLNEVSNNTNTIRTSTMRPDKLEFMTSVGPNNTEIAFKAKDKPSSAPTQEQSTQSTGIAGPNDSTAMASFPTDPSSPDSQKTTQSGDYLLVEQSTMAKQKITEPSQVTEQLISHSKISTIKISSEAVEEPSSDIMHEASTRSTGTNDSTAITSFPTEFPPQESQKNTQSRAPRLFTQQSTQHLQRSKQEISEPSQVTEQHIPDSTILTINISSKAAEETSSTIIHERIDRLTGITDTKDSRAMAYFPTHSPDSQKTTQSGDYLLVEQSTTAKQKITEPSQVTEQLISHSKISTIKISSEAVEEPSSDIMHEKSTRSTGTNDSTAITSSPTELPPQESQKNTQSRAPRLFTQQSTQHLQRSKQEISEPSQVTEQHIPDSTILTINISSKAAEDTSSTIIHERIDRLTGITDTKDSRAMASFPTHSPDSQKTTQSGDYLLVEQSTMAKQKITEPSQVTEQLISHSKISTIKISSEAVEEPSSDIMHEESTRSTGTNDSTAITSFPTEFPPQESQKNTQSRAPRLFTQQSTQHLQRSKQEISEPSQVTEQHIPDSTTLTINISSKAAEETSSTIIHERIDRLTGITDTNDSRAMASFPTHSPDSQKTTQSGDYLLVEQSTMAKQKITEPSQVTEQLISHSKISTIKISSEAVEEPSSDIMHEESTRSTGTNDSTAITSSPTELPPQESQKNTQSRAPRLFTQQSTQHLQRSKQEISEPSQVTEQHIPDSTTLTIKISSKAAEDTSSTIIHEGIDRLAGITDTKDSRAMAYFPTHSPDSQKTTQSGDYLLVEQSTMAKQKITEPSQVTEQLISHSKISTIKISSEAVEEPSSDIMHEESTRSTGTNDSTAITSFPTEFPPQESQKNTQSGTPSKAVEEPSSTTIHDQIARFTGMTGTTDSTAIMSFQTDLPSQESQKNTQSGAPRLLKQSTQHFLSPSQKILQSTALRTTPDMVTTYRNETAVNSHITHHGIPASTRGNNSLQPTSLPQTMKHEHPRRDITGMVKGISKPTLPARTKNPTLSSSAVKLEILETATYRHSVTWHNGKPNQFDQRVPKPTPPAFTLKQQIQDSTSLLLTEESPILHLSGFTSDPERHKPTPAEEPTNQYTEQNANNSAKSSRDNLMQHFMTTKTHILTNDSPVSSKTASTSPLPNLTEARLADSKGPGDTSVPTGISLHASTSSAAPFRTSQMNPKTQSWSTTNKYPILGTIISHTSVLLVKDISTQAPTDSAQSSQTISVSTEKLTVTFAPNPKPSENDTPTTTVVRHGFLTLRTQEIPFWISTKRSNLHPIETTEPQSDLTKQEPTAGTVAKENYTNDKPMQSTIGRKKHKTTRTATKKLSKTQNPRKLHKSSDTAIKDDTQTGRGIFGSLFSLGCLILLIIIILLWVVWRRWQARHWKNNIWVAGPPLLCGTYHSVLQSSSPHTAIEMMKGNTQKNKQENHDADESIGLRQQQKDIH